jgi:hypothetical protein
LKTDQHEPSEVKLRETLAIVASVIEEHGDEFWPVFELLEGELKKRKRRRKLLQKRLTDAHSFK